MTEHDRIWPNMTDGFMSIQLKHSHLYANMTDDRRNRISQKMHFLSKRLPFPYKTLPVSIQNATAAWLFLLLFRKKKPLVCHNNLSHWHDIHLQSFSVKRCAAAARRIYEHITNTFAVKCSYCGMNAPPFWAKTHLGRCLCSKWRKWA